MLEDILFKSPFDIKKGETFNLKEILNIDLNKQKYDQWKKEQINIEKQKIEQQFQIQFNSKLNNFKDLLTEKYDVAIVKKQAEILNQKNEEFLQLKNTYIEKIALLNSTILINGDKILDLQKNNEKRIKEIQLDNQNRIKELQNNNNQRIDQIQKDKDLQIVNLQNDKDKLNKNFTILNSIFQEKYAEKEKEILLQHQKQIDELKNKYMLEQKQANIIGELGEKEIKKQLKEIFPNDSIQNTNAALGEADVYQEIIVSGKKLGSIYYEVKNRNKWYSNDLNNFTEKTRKRFDDFNIYIGKTIMKESREQHIIKIDENLFFDDHSKVFITNFKSWLPIVFALRFTFIKYALQLNNETDKKTLHKDLYNFILSDEFKNYFSRIKTNLTAITKYFDVINNNALKGNAEVKKILNELFALESDIKIKTNN